jgi:dipeptidyl aminopeptidase/acylaminoacyl peptidase
MNLIRIILSIVCTLASAGLAVRVVVEHEARVTLDQQDGAYREQLSQMDQVIAENQRLSNLVAQADGPPSRPNERAEAPSGTDKRAEASPGTDKGSVASPGTDKRAEAPSRTDKRSQELVRLRGEVEVLRQQSKEIETLREDTRQVRAVQPTGPVTQSAGQAATMSPGAPADGSQFEILKAEYGTENASMDVTGELAAKLRNDALNTTATNALKTSASNDLKGDPDLGHTKTLTVVYQVGGVTMTNEFREGQPVILPGQ